MTTETGTVPEPLTPTRAGRIDAACDRFEERGGPASSRSLRTS
ncbi:MAG: hypothetical protein U0790_07065 [Isosphaeraceae bacterium]